MPINTDNIKKSYNLETPNANINNSNDRNAIISVSDKTNLQELGQYLLNNNFN